MVDGLTHPHVEVTHRQKHYLNFWMDRWIRPWSCSWGQLQWSLLKPVFNKVEISKKISSASGQPVGDGCELSWFWAVDHETKETRETCMFNSCLYLNLCHPGSSLFMSTDKGSMMMTDDTDADGTVSGIGMRMRVMMSWRYARRITYVDTANNITWQFKQRTAACDAFTSFVGWTVAPTPMCHYQQHPGMPWYTLTEPCLYETIQAQPRVLHGFIAFKLLVVMCFLIANDGKYRLVEWLYNSMNTMV